MHIVISAWQEVLVHVVTVLGTHRPVGSSHCSVVLQTTGVEDCAQPGTHAAATHTVEGGLQS
jgi:hypothetical protein